MTLGDKTAKGLTESVARASRIVDAIARAIPQGGTLHCEACGHVQGIQPNEVALYLRSGWPTCCGYTMRWEAEGRNA